MWSLMGRFWRDGRGVTALEYGLFTAMIVVGLIFILGEVRDGLNFAFTDITSDLNTADDAGHGHMDGDD